MRCPGGGIGRRKGLKIPRGQPRAGSSPAPGTTSRILILVSFFQDKRIYKQSKLLINWGSGVDSGVDF